MPSFHCHLPKLCHSVSYEWVLKKKHCFSWYHQQCGPSCGPVYATGQYVPGPSPQHAPVYGAGQSAAPVYGAGQHAFLPARSSTAIASAPAEMTPAISGSEEVPPAPEVKATTSNGSQGGLLLPTPSGN
jgi:hypothetical protein